MSATLDLVIPGLFGPWSAASDGDVGALDLRLPALQRLLGRADRTTTERSGFEPVMFALFGVDAEPGRDLPIAAVTRLADGGSPDDAFWLRADPVHLRADLHQVRLFDARFLDLSGEEADDLVAEINPLLADDGLTLHALRPQRWYLQCQTPPAIATAPLPALIGKDVNPHLPSGPDKERWHALLTEIQMLIHASDVNDERSWDNQLEVNSVWFWGGGALPEGRRLRSPALNVYADDPLGRGLCRCVAAQLRPLPQQEPWQYVGGSSLAVLETIRYYGLNDDPFRWSDRLRRLENLWFEPALERLKSGDLDAVVIHPCDGSRYRASRAGLRRFWKNPQPLQHYLS